MSAFDKLKQFADRPKAKRSSAEEITDVSMQPACETLVAASRGFKDAEAELKNAQEAILDYMRPIHSAEIREGTPSTTYKLNELLMCIFTDRFGALKDFEVAEAKERLSKAKVPFDRLFKEKVKLKLKESVSENEKELENLINQLGDLLPRFFEVSVETSPVDDFDKALAREGVYGDLADIVERARYKPTIRVS